MKLSRPLFVTFSGLYLSVGCIFFGGNSAPSLIFSGIGGALCGGGGALVSLRLLEQREERARNAL